MGPADQEERRVLPRCPADRGDAVDVWPRESPRSRPNRGRVGVLDGVSAVAVVEGQQSRPLPIQRDRLPFRSRDESGSRLPAVTSRPVGHRGGHAVRGDVPCPSLSPPSRLIARRRRGRCSVENVARRTVDLTTCRQACTLSRRRTAGRRFRWPTAWARGCRIPVPLPPDRLPTRPSFLALLAA